MGYGIAVCKILFMDKGMIKNIVKGRKKKNPKLLKIQRERGGK